MAYPLVLFLTSIDWKSAYGLRPSRAAHTAAAALTRSV